MKKIACVIGLLLGVFWGIQGVHAQWVQTGGPYGGTITAMTTYLNGKGGTNIMAGTSVGAFLSTDNGTSWTPVGIVNFGFSPPVSFLATVPDSSGGSHLYAGMGDGVGIYRSDNNGSTWTYAGTSTGYTPTAFAVDTTGSNGMVLLAGNSQGVYISTDSGASWKVENNGLTSTDIKALAVVSDGSGTTYWFAGTFGGMFVSTNNGTSWTAANSGIPNPQGYTAPPISAIAVIPNGSSGPTILAGTQYGGVFLSTNYGSNWTAAANSPSFAKSFIMASDGSGNTSIFAGTFGSGMYRSDNSGSSWTQVNNGLSGFNATYINSLSVTGNGTNNVCIFAGSVNGLYRSDNNGSDWTESDTGITAIFLNALTAATDGTGATTIFAGGGGLYRSTDNGASWSEVDNDDIKCLAVTPDGKGGNYIYAGTLGNGIIRSHDNGSSWEPINNGMTGNNVISIITDDSVIIISVYPQGFFISDDHGDNWRQGISNKSDPYSDPSYAIDNMTWQKYWNYLKNHFPQKMLTLAMNGDSWTSVAYGLPFYDDVDSFAAMSDSIVFVGTNDSGIYRLSGSDTTWTAVNNGLTGTADKEVNFLTTYGSSSVFAATLGGVFLSKDNGANWKAVNTGLGDMEIETIQSLAASPKGSTGGAELFAGTWGSGVWRRPISDMITAVQKTQSTAPTRFILDQNYPNPFNPTTTIRYQLTQAGMVHLNVYNTLGQRVSELVNAPQSTGFHSVTFDASYLSSGVYFYRLRITGKNGEKFSSIKKMLLIK